LLLVSYIWDRFGIFAMPKKIGFRFWYYFRTGWQTYFAFIFAAINTLTVTYFLAVENYPVLKEIFPTFIHYIVILLLVVVPILIFIGYAHFKRTSAYSSEADVVIESNPYYYKLPPRGYWMTAVMPLFVQLTNMMIKWSNNEKFSKEEQADLLEIQKQLSLLIKGGSTRSAKHD
tara:strand:+ start:42 stop:563 length:522 start_codon:yes stop_codon:yes gene_type:complete